MAIGGYGRRKMNPLIQLINRRNAGWVRVSFVSNYHDPLPKVLARLGLQCAEFPDPQLREVPRSEARSILVSLLRQDMAYRAELMPQAEAESFADQFLGNFSSDDARFITNLDQPDNPARPFDGGYSPMTQSTFDGGIIGIENSLVGCFWVEDED